MSLIFIRERASKDSEPYFYNKREGVRTLSLIFIIREKSKDSELYFYNKRESE